MQVRTFSAYRYKMDTKAPVDGTAAPRFERYDCSGGCPVEAVYVDPGDLEQVVGGPYAPGVAAARGGTFPWRRASR